MFAMAGLNDDPEIVKASQEMFAKWAKGDKNAIHPDLRSAVFAIAMKNGGQAEVSPTKSVSNL
jgi:aminopeptidase 2